MDQLDRQILDLLTHNARMPVKEIAARVSLTSPAVSSRIRRLEQTGVIGGYTVVISAPESPRTVHALISVSVAPEDRDEFLADVAAEPQVNQCFHVTGSHSYIVKVACEGMQALEHLISRYQRSGPSTPPVRSVSEYKESAPRSEPPAEWKR